MIPQIIGTKKSKQFRACERYCKERGITFQSRDPIEKPLSPGEIDAIVRAVGDPQELIDTESTAFKKKGLEWMDYEPIEEIIENPQLLRRPIVRTDKGLVLVPSNDDLDGLFHE